jgi:hypothetical protein
MKSESGPIRPSLLTRIAFHVDRTSTKRAYSKLNSRAEVVDYYTYEDLQRKLVVDVTQVCFYPKEILPVCFSLSSSSSLKAA